MPSRREVLRFGGLVAAGGVTALTTSRVRSQHATGPEHSRPLDPSWKPFSAGRWTEQSRQRMPGEPNAITPFEDGRLLIAGTRTVEDEPHGWVAIVGTDGTVESSQTLDRGRLFTATQTAEGVLVGGILNDHTAAQFVTVGSNGTVKANDTVAPRRGQVGVFELEAVPSRNGGKPREALVAGGLISSNDWWDSVWLVGLDARGQKRWRRTYDASVLIITGALVAGPSRVHLVGNLDGSDGTANRAGIVSITDGATDWRQIYAADMFWDVASPHDGSGDMLVVGDVRQQDGPDTGFLARLDDDGKIRWWKTIGQLEGSVSVRRVVSTAQQCLVFGRVSRDEKSDREFILSTDGSGSQARGYWVEEPVESATLLPDGKLVVGSGTDGSYSIRVLSPEGGR
ncbi:MULTISPECIES: hypothetical protein [Haloferax]|uniref:Uncharacterized protein n=1 Tax=Haloferax marinum TaxID=2666143 RepID=A0A6A8G6B5_9EURY|nr:MULTISPECIES: hypothetical protein [Haloferax]KAB1197306.1 hypothetical protein Hfx1150_07185 [Haloferax sp. CBA1150]MRW96347.1 hypothetical protein [Haloferax marinum]